MKNILTLISLGRKEEKLMHKQFHELLIAINKLACSEQSTISLTSLMNGKPMVQLDDVCVISVKA